jgi:DnaJ like chaperone protein
VVAAKRNPYEVLGIDPSIGNEELKTHYRKLIAENHPDKLLARGVPEEFIAIATEKVATINEAYEAIARERGI